MTPEKEEFEVAVDTSEAERELEQLRRHAIIAQTSVLEVTKRSTSLLLDVMDLFGYSLGATIELLIGATLMMATAYRSWGQASAVAATAGANPLLYAKAVLEFSAASIMFYRAFLLQQQKTEMESKLATTMSIVNTLSYW